jgi:hypothetical protein
MERFLGGTDDMVELNLDDDGTFTLYGIYDGYEDTCVRCAWTKRREYIHLSGRGSMWSCTRRFDDRPFQATYMHTPFRELKCLTDLTAWSLLDTGSRLRPVPLDTPSIARSLEDPL